MGSRTASDDGLTHNYGLLNSIGKVRISDAIIGVAAMKLPLMDVFGLALQMQSFPEFNPGNSTIYPSITAALLWDYMISAITIGSAGAVCIVNKGTEFNNCLQGANFSWYVNDPLFTTSGTQIINSESLVSGILVNSTGLSYPFSQIAATPQTEVGLQVTLYKHLDITSPGFPTFHNFNNLKYGIRSIGGDDINITTSINNCRIGISSLGMGFDAFPLINIQSSFINNTETAIQGSGSLMRISDNFINNLPASSPNRIGIYLRGCDFDVYDNEVNRVVFGCMLMSNGANADQVRLNHFNNNVVPVWAFGNNGNLSDGGVQITCNTFNNYVAAIHHSNYQPFVPSPFPPQLGSLDNQGNCDEVEQHPADNLFIPSLMFADVTSTAAGSFTYFHRANTPTQQFEPTISGNPSKLVCESAPDIAENCGGGLLLPDEDIKLLPLGRYLDKMAAKKMFYYLQNGDKIAAANLLKDLSSNFAQQKALPYYREQQNTTEVEQRLNTLPSNDAEAIAFKQLQQIYWDMTQDARTFMQLNPNEEAIVRQIAASNTQAAFDAHTILFLRYGEEYVIPLPELPAYLDSSAIANFDWGGVYFKTNPNQLSENSIGVVLPNPANDQFFVPYHICDSCNAVLRLYDTNGRLAYDTSLQGIGTLEISTNDMPTGVYILQVISVNGQTLHHQKVVIVK